MNTYAFWRDKMFGAVRKTGLGIPFAGLATIVANCFTIPLGFGVAVVFPGEKFIRIPFQIWHEIGLAWLMVSFWVAFTIMTQ